MRNESTATFVQQARTFNSVPDEVPVQTRHPLMSQPSLSCLASRPNEFHCNDSSNTEFNTNPTGVEPDSNSVCGSVTNAVDECTTDRDVNLENKPLTIEQCSFQRNSIFLPPDIAFQVHLASVLQRHRGNDLNMFQEITECISKHAIHHGVKFDTMHMLSRHTLVKKLTDEHKLHFLRPNMHLISLSNGSKATVPVYNVKQLLLSFLDDPNRMKPENFAPGYDIFSGRPTTPVTHLHEIHTGSTWKNARDFYIGEDPDAFPFALQAFYDKTHTDLFGSLSCSPFIVVPTFLNMKSRNDDKNYLVLGYIPNLGHAKGKAKKQSATSRLQDEHNCLRLITNQIAQIHSDGGFWTTVMGRKVRVVVWIHFIAGDTKGHNDLVGHYNGGQPKYIYRDCYCEMEQLSNPRPQCKLITIADIKRESQTPDGLANLSKKKIQNAFDGVPLSDNVHGLLGIVPAEMLHISGTGLLKYLFKSLCELIGTENSNKKEKEAFDDLHRCLVMDAQRQSEQRMPRMSIRNGITDGTKMCGSERVGNFFILLCVMYTTSGKCLLSDGLSRERIPLQRFRDCIKLYLGFEQWVNDSHPIQEVKDAYGLLAHLISEIQICFPKRWGWGWNIPKIHSLAKMLDNMLKFGSAKNFSGQTGERALKSIVKDHAQRTQRRADKFAEQCAIREYEDNVIEFVYHDISGQLGMDCKREQNADLCKYKVEGEFTIHFGKSDTQGRGTVGVTWKNKKRMTVGIAVSEQLLYCIRKYAHGKRFFDQFSITGYTNLKIYFDEYGDESVKFYANEYMYGEPRYDFAMVRFLDHDRTIKTAPAKVIGFVKYNLTKSIPTPYFCEELGQSLHEIRKNDVVDDNLYVVVHSSSTYLSLLDLQSNFVCKFVLGDVNTCMYIIKIDDIVCPLFVFKNYGGEGKKGKDLFCALPQPKWGNYFANKIASHNTKRR